LEEGLAWKNFTKAEHPTFWVKVGAQWRLRLMLDEVAMPWDWPVETNYHEAKAFCQWKARISGQTVRLPTEDEWQALRQFAGVDDLPAIRPISNSATSPPVARSTGSPMARCSMSLAMSGNGWKRQFILSADLKYTDLRRFHHTDV
jgi:hypothetical protein